MRMLLLSLLLVSPVGAAYGYPVSLVQLNLPKGLCRTEPARVFLVGDVHDRREEAQGRGASLAHSFEQVLERIDERLPVASVGLLWEHHSGARSNPRSSFMRRSAMRVRNFAGFSFKAIDVLRTSDVLLYKLAYASLYQPKRAQRLLARSSRRRRIAKHLQGSIVAVVRARAESAVSCAFLREDYVAYGRELTKLVDQLREPAKRSSLPRLAKRYRELLVQQAFDLDLLDRVIHAREPITLVYAGYGHTRRVKKRLLAAGAVSYFEMDQRRYLPPIALARFERRMGHAIERWLRQGRANRARMALDTVRRSHDVPCFDRVARAPSLPVDRHAQPRRGLSARSKRPCVAG